MIQNVHRHVHVNILLCDGISVFGTVIHSTLVQRGGKNTVHENRLIRRSLSLCEIVDFDLLHGKFK